MDFISRIRKKLSKNKTDVTGTNIRNKLNGLEENLRRNINDFNVKRNRPTKLNPPLINLNEDEKKLLSNIIENDYYEAKNIISVSNSQDSDLDFIINFF